MLLRDMREIIGKDSTLTLISDKLALDNSFGGGQGNAISQPLPAKERCCAVVECPPTSLTWGASI